MDLHLAFFSYFLKNLESILNLICSNSIDLIISGDLNINYFNDNCWKQILNSLLALYCLYSTVQLSTRILNNSSSAVNNIFINKVKNYNYTVYHLVDGLSNMVPRLLYIYIFPPTGSAAQRGLWPTRPRGYVITYDTSQSAGLLWTSDQLIAETST
jgi:hypothetical protein